ncbi:MAG: hypothetical protein ACI9QQ_000155 [Myxococcota bacterium]
MRAQSGQSNGRDGRLKGDEWIVEDSMRLRSLLLVALLTGMHSGAVSAETEPPVLDTEMIEQLTDEVVPAELAAVEPDVGEVEALDAPTADVDVLAEESADSEEDFWSDDEATDETAQASDETMTDDVGTDVAREDLEEPSAADEMSEAAMEEEVTATEPVAIEGSAIVVNGVTLGPVGVDSEGRVGRIHTIASGDTLWDVSHAYLGTAWVWPSVWNDNSAIQNPHLIEPGNRLWISSTEIRAITEAEADEYLASAEAPGEPWVEEVALEIPADMDPEIVEEMPVADDQFEVLVAMEELPVVMPDDSERSDETGRVVRVASRENMGFVSDAQLEASTTILGSPSDRKHLSMLDIIYLGLGEGEVEIGDQFTFFRNLTDVRSPSNNQLLGYHVDVLGWAEVIEVTGETCVAVIQVSLDGAMKGDRVMPRYQPPTDIRVKYPREAIDGEIAFLPANRTLMGTTDYVFLDVGVMQGVEIGTDLEVYDGGGLVMDHSRKKKLRTPDRVIADLIVVTVQEETAVAYIAHARRELAVGDTIRGATRDFPGAF